MFTVLYDTVYIDSVLNENDEQFDEWVSKIITSSDINGHLAILHLLTFQTPIYCVE